MNSLRERPVPTYRLPCPRCKGTGSGSGPRGLCLKCSGSGEMIVFDHKGLEMMEEETRELEAE